MSKNTRFLNLDALRGISALLVIWQHTSEFFITTPAIAAHGTLLSDIAEKVDLGRIGVICFFLISGFVIPYSLNRNLSNPIKSFVTRRFFRLYPAYWLALLVAAFLSPFLLSKTAIPNAASIAANTTMLQGLFGFHNIVPVSWSLTVEFLFYFISATAFCFKLIDNPRHLLLFCWAFLGFFVVWHLAGKLIYPKITAFPPTITYIPYCLAVMFCGTLIRHCYDNKQDYMITTIAIASVFALPTYVLISSLWKFDLVKDPVRFGLSHLISLGLFFAILCIKRKPPKFLLWLGLISYSLYLFHAPVMQLMHWSFHGWADFLPKMPLWFYIGLVSLGSIGIATLSYYFIEKPSIAMGRRFSQQKQSELKEKATPAQLIVKSVSD